VVAQASRLWFPFRNTNAEGSDWHASRVPYDVDDR